MRLFSALAEAFARILTLFKNRAFVSTVVLVIVGFCAAAASLLAVDNLMVLTGADRFVQDWEIASLSRAEPQDPNIVIVAIKESTLAQFPYRSPVDRAFLAGLLSTLAQRHPRAIGLDILFDQPTDAKKDALLHRTLLGLRIPLTVAYTSLPSIVTREQLAWLDAFVPERMRGDATLPEDQFDTVREMFPGMRDPQGRFIPGFPRAIAASVGKKTPPEALPIVWHGRPSQGVAAFAEFPAETAGLLPPSWLAGKILLIGADLSLREDKHRTPFAAVLPGGEGTLPGVTIHAHALAQLLENRAPVHLPWKDDLLIAFACAIVGGALGILQLHLVARLLAGTFFLVAFWAAGATLYHVAGSMIGLVAPSIAFIATFSAMESLAGREARQQRQFIQGAFSRYVSPEVVKALVRDPTRMSLQGERREMTFLFTDIENFTAFSEHLESRELARLLNSYFDGVTQIVLKHGGMVDKFIGDAVFAIFNAPIELADHPARAVRCALEIDRFARTFRSEHIVGTAGFGTTRIGVHTGEAVIGNFGSSSRFAYTAQGDAVNIASRLEALNKRFGTHISTSGETRRACAGIAFRPIGSVVLKGKSTAVEVWEPLQEGSWNDGLLDLYCTAYASAADAAPDALAQFEALGARLPADTLILLYQNRLRRGEKGVTFVMDAK